MKKQLVLFILLLLPIMASAEIFGLTCDGVDYYLYSQSQTAQVVKKWNKYSGAVVIPSSVYFPITGKYYSVTSISSDAFRDCSGLTSITIPNSVKSIGVAAFKGCSGLTTIIVKSGNTKYDSRNSCNAIIETASNKLISGCKNTVIPNSVTSIDQSAFEGCSGLTSVTIPNSVTSIGVFAFKNCSGLTSVTIPNSVTSIGVAAFKGCSGLTSVTLNSNAIASMEYDGYSSLKDFFGEQVTEYIIGEDVTGIGSYAFYGCSGLTSVTIPNSVTSIGDNAFCDCSGLTSVTVFNPTPIAISQNVFSNRKNATLYVPSGSKSAYQAADYWKEFKEIIEIEIPLQVDGLYYYLDTDNHQAQVTYKTYKPYGLYTGSITIPSSITYDDISYDVTSIGSSVFEGCSSLTSITIPNSVTSIGGSAFSGCSGLTSVTIGNSVTSIGDGAFSGCSSLTTVTLNSNYLVSASYHARGLGEIFGEQVKEYIIGDDVTSIGGSAFYGCSGLTSVTIPNSVTSIGDGAFSGCSSLTTVTLNSNDIVSASYHARGLGEIFGEQVKDYIIGDDVARIGELAFCGCSNLTSITIGKSVARIGARAFYGCSNLTTVTINSNALVSASYNSYDPSDDYYDIKFKNVFGEQVKEYIIGGDVTSIGGSVFEGCSSLTSVMIPNSVTSIGGEAFKDCTGLISITIPNSVTEIGWSAFYGCSSLATFYCDGYNLTNIGGSAFYGTAWYNNHPDGLVYFCQVAYKYKGDMPANTSITLNEGTIVIASSAFSGCTGLTSITIPNSVTSIGEGVFSGCSGLTSITIPNSVTSISTMAFYRCSGLTSITIPNSVTRISADAFSYCSGLTSITIPNSVTSIGSSAFHGCSGLTSITIPNGVTSIGSATFYGCSGLTSIIIPNSVTSIGMAAFYGCSGLTSVTIGNSVTSIGYNAFTDCSGLQHLYSLAKNVPQAANAFEKGIAFSLATLHVPAESMYSYNAAEGWNKFINIVALTDEEMTDVKSLKFDAEDESSTIYNMNGVRQSKTQRGLNIIRMKDGTTRKVVVK